MSSDTSIVFGEYDQGTRQFVGWRPRTSKSNASTYTADTLQANMGTLSSDSTSGIKSIAVTSHVQGDFHWVFTTPPTITGNDG